MRKLTRITPKFYKAIKEDLAFYCLMIAICVPLYILFDWLGNLYPTN